MEHTLSTPTMEHTLPANPPETVTITTVKIEVAGQSEVVEVVENESSTTPSQKAFILGKGSVQTEGAFTYYICNLGNGLTLQCILV